MARFAFGKVKKRSFWDIEQLGRTLRSQDVDPVSPRLPGFQTFASESAARVELERVSAEHIAEGFVPDDDDAHAIASLVAKPAAEAVAVTFPVRKDMHVYNEATGFMVTSMDIAGVRRAEGSEKWTKSVADSSMIPVTRMQDDPCVVGGVAGDPLTSQEEEEWVAKLA